MRLPRSFRLPRRTLQAQLAFLYAALFGVSCVALAGVAVIFKPNFVVGSSCRAAPGTPARSDGCQSATHLSFAGTVGHDLRQNLAGAALIVALAVLALGLGWLLAGRVLRPLRTITATARDISARNLNQRLAVAGPDDEFRQLGDTLDGLFGRLEASFQAQRHFVANASHELRTPLAAEKTVLQVALADPDASPADLRSACQKALEWTDRQESLIGSLLTLASTERGIERWEPFDLADVAAQAVLHRHQEAQRRDLRVDTALASAPATGDPALAQSLVANLVSNAIRHNLDGGRVEVATAIVDGLAVLTVSNTGPLVPADDVDQLFRPFRRLGGQRLRQHTGHGLGLAIVSAIVTAHRAEITARPRPEGGLDVTVTFP
jgi:signal transduction histidine kinase